MLLNLRELVVELLDLLSRLKNKMEKISLEIKYRGVCSEAEVWIFIPLAVRVRVTTGHIPLVALPASGAIPVVNTLLTQSIKTITQQLSVICIVNSTLEIFINLYFSFITSVPFSMFVYNYDS